MPAQVCLWKNSGVSVPCFLKLRKLLSSTAIKAGRHSSQHHLKTTGEWMHPPKTLTLNMRPLGSWSRLPCSRHLEHNTASSAIKQRGQLCTTSGISYIAHLASLNCGTHCHENLLLLWVYYTWHSKVAGGVHGGKKKNQLKANKNKGISSRSGSPWGGNCIWKNCYYNSFQFSTLSFSKHVLLYQRWGSLA